MKGKGGRGARLTTAQGKKHKSLKDEASAISNKLEKAAGSSNNSVTSVTCLFILSLAARVRALESILIWCCTLPIEDDMFDVMSEIGKEHNQSIYKAKETGAHYESEAPIHILCYVGALEILKEEIPAIQEYVDGISENGYIEAVGEIKYFRKIRCYDKTQTRLLVHIVAGSKADNAWISHILPFLRDKRACNQKLGMAPRSGKERKFLKQFMDIGIIKMSKDSETMEVDNEI